MGETRKGLRSMSIPKSNYYLKKKPNYPKFNEVPQDHNWKCVFCYPVFEFFDRELRQKKQDSISISENKIAESFSCDGNKDSVGKAIEELVAKKFIILIPNILTRVKKNGKKVVLKSTYRLHPRLFEDVENTENVITNSIKLEQEPTNEENRSIANQTNGEPVSAA